MLTREEKVTVNAYDKDAKSWSDSHFGKNVWSRELRYLKKILPKGKIIEIGCGGGRDAQKLLTMGYDYLGTDVSEGFVNEAKKNNPKAKFLVRSIYGLNFPKMSFDGFWCSATLLHIPKTRIDEALKSIHSLIKKDGIGFITIKKGRGEKVLEEESSDGKTYKRLWAFYSDKQFKEILKRNRFNIVHSRIHPVTKRTTWLIYFVEVV
jgi:SAM-dependent methyltransferase